MTFLGYPSLLSSYLTQEVTYLLLDSLQGTKGSHNTQNTYKDWTSLRKKGTNQDQL